MISYPVVFVVCYLLGGIFLGKMLFFEKTGKSSEFEEFMFLSGFTFF